MQALLETGLVARILGVSGEYVRRLADAGKLPIAARTATGRRLFTGQAVEQLRQARARRAGHAASAEGAGS